ncbi:MAG: hypothetical protein GY916_06995 [Gammaproteobacteria bacterium]|nr:hypothetical protein [Gammaproteobacteria bacterium]
MESVRCVIADIPQQLLAKIVQSTVEENGLVEVVDRVSGIADIASVVANSSAEVLVMGMDSSDLPDVCTQVMNRIADILVIGLVDDGRRLSVFLDNASKNDIPKIIQALHRSNPESTQ